MKSVIVCGPWSKSEAALTSSNYTAVICITGTSTGCTSTLTSCCSKARDVLPWHQAYINSNYTAFDAMPAMLALLQQELMSRFTLYLPVTRCRVFITLNVLEATIPQQYHKAHSYSAYDHSCSQISLCIQ